MIAMIEAQLALAGLADGPPSVPEGTMPGPTFANFFYVDLSKNTPEPADDGSFIELDAKAIQKGRMIDEMRAELLTLTGGWPQRVGSKLFATTPDNNVQWLGSASDLFAWIEPQAKVMWKRGEGMVPRDVFYRHLLMTVDRFDAIETVPHIPSVPGICYIHPPLPESDGSHLDWLVKRFSPLTSDDGVLIQAFFLSLFWGGHPGSQPAWLFTGPDGDEQRGRGIGKSKIAELAGLLAGGTIEVSPREDIVKIKKRLLSAEAMKMRVARIDNIKDQKFSWGDLEALITSPVVSGHQMHKGEAQRPNTLIWVLTLNGARLSRDMAQRCIIVKLQRPEYSPTWESETRAFIETNRWKIISDIGMALTGTVGSSTKEGDSDGTILPMGGVGGSSPGKSGPRRKGKGTRRRKAK